MKCYKIDKDGAAKAIDITANLESYYREIECDCIDIACLTVDGHPFDFIVDDVGLLKENPIVTVIEASGFAPRLVGTVLVFGCGEYDIRGLTDDEVELLEESTLTVTVSRNDEEISYREILLVD